jgi:DNA repair protein RadC
MSRNEPARAKLSICPTTSAHFFEGRGGDLDDLRDRLFLRGPDFLSEPELLSLLLSRSGPGQGAMETGARLWALFGPRGLARARPHEFARAAQLGRATAARVAAGLSLGRRLSEHLGQAMPMAFDDPEAVEAWATPRLVSLEHEEVWSLSFDVRHRLLSETRIATGGVAGAALRPSDVLGPALRDGARGFILVHNHPSGDPTPSPSDIHMTRELDAAARVTGVAFIDHVVVARAGSVSLRHLGVLPSL